MEDVGRNRGSDRIENTCHSHEISISPTVRDEESPIHKTDDIIRKLDDRVLRLQCYADSRVISSMAYQPHLMASPLVIRFKPIVGPHDTSDELLECSIDR